MKFGNSLGPFAGKLYSIFLNGLTSAKKFWRKKLLFLGLGVKNA